MASQHVNNWTICTAKNVSKYGVISDPNTGKYGPEVTPYLDTFDAVLDKEELMH